MHRAKNRIKQKCNLNTHANSNIHRIVVFRILSCSFTEQNLSSSNKQHIEQGVCKREMSFRYKKDARYINQPIVVFPSPTRL